MRFFSGISFLFVYYITQAFAYNGSMYLNYANVSSGEVNYPPDTQILPLPYWSLRSGIRALVGTPPQVVSSCQDVSNNKQDYLSAMLCEQTSGCIFLSNQSTSFTDSSTEIEIPIERPSGRDRAELGYIVNGTLVNDLFTILSPPSSPGYSSTRLTFALDRTTTGQAIGSTYTQISNTFGLGLNSSILQNAGQRHFSYAGPGLDTNNPNPDWSLAIGWNNRTQAVGPFYTSPINTTQNNQNTITSLTTNIANISLNGQVITNSVFAAALDISSITLNYLPFNIFYAIRDFANSILGTGNFTLYNAHTVPSRLSEQWNMTITLDNGFNWTVPQQQLFMNRSSGAGQSVSTFRNEDLQRTVYSPAFVAGPLLGKEILAEAYIEVDYALMEWTIARMRNAVTTNSGVPSGAGRISESPGRFILFLILGLSACVAFL